MKSNDSSSLSTPISPNKNTHNKMLDFNLFVINPDFFLFVFLFFFL